MSVEISPFDSQISLLYKVGSYLETPTKYILTRPKEEGEKSTEITLILGDIAYEPYPDVIADLLDDNLTIDEIYAEIGEEMARIDFSFLYSLGAGHKEVSEADIYAVLNQFLQGEEKFNSIGGYRIQRDEWLTEWNRLVKEEDIVAENLELAQDKLESIADDEKLESTQVIIDRVLLQLKPTSSQTGDKISLEEGIDIFNSAIASNLVPYIQYNKGNTDATLNDKSYYKVYRGSSVTTDNVGVPDISMIIPPERTVADNSAIYATIWMGEEDAVITNPIRENYTRVTFDLTTGILSLKVLITEKNPQAKENTLTRLAAAFPTLQLGQSEEVRVSGEFDILIREPIIDYVLLDLIMNDPTFTSYLYVDERQTAYPEKKRLTIHYRPILDESGEIPPKNTVSAVLTTNYNPNYLRVNITQSNSRETADEFREIFTLLLSLYLKEKKGVIDLYAPFIPPQKKAGVEVKPKKTGTREKSNIYNLQSIAPDIFIKHQSGYARVCQGHSQPMIIEPEEREEWEAKLVYNKKKGEYERRQVIPFPKPPGDRFLLVCPDDNRAYPGLKVNTIPQNKDEFPYLPCCYDADHSDPGKDNPYTAYYYGKEIKPKGAKKRMNITTTKILSGGGIGDIPIPLERALLTYSNEASNIKRYGVAKGPNSFIHCILDALNYNNYEELSNQEKEKLVRRVREDLLNHVYPEVMKQELYDFSNEEISASILSLDTFFDPSLYYRSLEEYFDINIYTFTSGKKPKEDQAEAVGKIDLPRMKLFHSQVLRPNRETVLIYKHLGAESDSLRIPHCELLIDYNKDNKTQIKVFGSDMTQTAFNMLQETFPNNTWYYSGEMNKEVQSIKNLYSRMNPDAYLQNAAQQQIIDNYGKLRGLIFPYKGINVTAFFVPSQPVNLQSFIGDIVPKASYKEATAIFGNPIAATFSLNKKNVTGLWFPHPSLLEYPYSIYVPVKNTRQYLTLQEGPSPPINTTKPENRVNRTVRNLRLEKQITVLIQLIEWLFLLSPQMTPKEFMDTYQEIYPEEVVDSSTFYDLSSIPRKLPEVESKDTALAFLEDNANTFVNGGKIIFYSQLFANKILGYLTTFSRNTRAVMPTYLNGYYTHESDFKREPNTALLIGEENFKSWLGSLERSSYSGLTTLNKLDITLSQKIEPYIYLSENGTTYLIQNVEGGSLKKAIEAALVWNSDSQNPGYTARDYPDPDTIPYLVYEISPSSNLRVLQDLTEGSEEFLSLLDYANGQYAALLPLS